MKHQSAKDYHFFKKSKFSRFEVVQKIIIDIISKKKLPSNKLVWGKPFELIHSSSVTHIGRILAERRGLNIELAQVMCALHDIYVFATGKLDDHGSKGALIAEKLLLKTQQFSRREIKLISKGIRHHSDKHLTSADPYVELVKDADVFDCSLFENFKIAYIMDKPPKILKFYFTRIQKVRKELRLPFDPQWK